MRFEEVAEDDGPVSEYPECISGVTGAIGPSHDVTRTAAAATWGSATGTRFSNCALESSATAVSVTGILMTRAIKQKEDLRTVLNIFSLRLLKSQVAGNIAFRWDKVKSSFPRSQLQFGRT